MTKEELFTLVQKANRRRKSAEQSLKKMRAKVLRISFDATTAIGSRARVIEEQWEVIKELQRRGLISTEDLEKVIFDVTGMKKIRFKED